MGAEELPLILSQLQDFLGIAEIAIYAGVILFFGSIAITGFRAPLRFPLPFLLRIALGFLALFWALALNPYIPFFKTGLYRLLQLDLLLAGIISSALLALALFFGSAGLETPDRLREQIRRLEEKIRHLQDRKPRPQLVKAMNISGAAAIAALTLFAVLTFPGFPSLTEDLFSTIGLQPEQLENLGDLLQESEVSLSPECIDLIALVNRQFGSGVIDLTGLDIQPYADASLEAAMQEKLRADAVILVRTDVEGTLLVVGTAGNRSCVATEAEVCFCG